MRKKAVLICCSDSFIFSPPMDKKPKSIIRVTIKTLHLTSGTLFQKVNQIDTLIRLIPKLLFNTFDFCENSMSSGGWLYDLI